MGTFITLLLDKGPLQRQDNLVRRSALGRWRISRSPWRRQRGSRALGGRLRCPAAGQRGTGERREGEQHLVYDPRRGLVAQGAGEVPAIKASTSHPRDQGMVAYWHVNCHNSKGIPKEVEKEDANLFKVGEFSSSCTWSKRPFIRRWLTVHLRHLGLFLFSSKTKSLLGLT